MLSDAQKLMVSRFQRLVDSMCRPGRVPPTERSAKIQGAEELRKAAASCSVGDVLTPAVSSAGLHLREGRTKYRKK